MSQPSALSSLLAGARDTLPMLIGAAPFGMIFGAMVGATPLAPQGQGLELNWHNPQLIAALVAIAVCAVTRHQLLTILIGLLVFFGWQFCLG